MSVFTFMMVGAAVAVMAAHYQSGRTVTMIIIAITPFLAIPGLTDPVYLPVIPNSPFLGGILAIMAAWVLIYLAREPWQLLLPSWLCVMVLWNIIRIVGATGINTHAVGLEVIFYAMLAMVFIARFWNEIGAFMPDPNKVRDLVAWRVGGRS